MPFLQMPPPGGLAWPLDGDLQRKVLVAVIAWGLAAVVVQIGDLPDADGRRIATTLAITLGLSGLLPLIFTRGRHLSWVVLFASAGLLLAWSLR